MAVDLTQSSASSAAQDASALRRAFGAITEKSCPHFFNFHMHTVYSDGQLKPEQLMQQAVDIGLQGFAITDHHTVNGYRRAQQWLEDWQQSAVGSVPHLWTGTEINANLLNTEVHILAYAFDPAHVAIEPYLQGETVLGEDYEAAQVIAAIHQAGGLAVLAHPARYKRSSAELIPQAAQLGIDGIETYYAYNNPSPWMPSPKQTKEAQELGKTYGLLNTCGTDTHGLNLLQRL
jgi:predicted metal-dependent phosphoesterase TrpH